MQHEVVDVVFGQAVIGLVVLDDEAEFALEFVHDFVVACQTELIATCHHFKLWKKTLDVLEIGIVDAVDFGRIKAFNTDLTLT